MRTNNKGQAAMEFLMTYGWAILAAVIAIGVLAYFGVFSPGKYTTGSTVVNPPFYASAWNVKDSACSKAGVVGTDCINLELQNNGGEDYTITNVSIVGCGSFFNGSSVVIPQSKAQIFDINCTYPVGAAGDIGAVGKSFKGDITISYTKGTSTLGLTSTGTLAEKITN